MKSVLFIDKGSESVWPSYLSLSAFLEGWHRRGLFEVCSWRPAARSARAAVPALPTILEDEQEWQAVIVCDLRGEASDLADDPHFDNPFDFRENYERDIDAPVEESERAVVRLCQMLGGLPDKVRMEERDEDDERAGLVKLSYPQSDEYYDFVDRYRTNLPAPQRIICVSPRLFDPDVYRARSRELLGIAKAETLATLEDGLDEDIRTELRSEHEALAEERAWELTPRADTVFWERNNYPASTRFVVYDWPIGPRFDEEARDASVGEHVDPTSERRMDQQQWLSFWSGVLTLLTADFSSAELRPYRLYRMAPQITAEGVRAAVSSRWSEWAGVRRQVEDQIEVEARRLRRSEYSEQEIPDCTTKIPVHFDVPRSELHVDPAEVGLYRDVPRPDREVWAESHRATTRSLRAMLRSPRRALDRAVHAFRSKSVMTQEDLEYCVLTEVQRLDLQDDLIAEEYALAESTGRRAFREQSHTEAFEEHSQAIIDRIEDRPHTPERRLAILALLGGTILGLAAAFPAMVVVKEALRSTIGVSIASILLPALVVALFLFIQRNAIRKAYEGLNAWLKGIVTLLEAEALRLSERLSLYAKVRKEWSVLRRQERLSQPTARGQWLEERLALMTYRMSGIVSVVGEPKRDLSAYARARQLPWSETSLLLEDESFFDASSSVASSCPLLTGSGEAGSVTAPFGFVESVRLEALRIY